MWYSEVDEPGCSGAPPLRIWEETRRLPQKVYKRAHSQDSTVVEPTKNKVVQDKNPKGLVGNGWEGENHEPKEQPSATGPETKKFKAEPSSLLTGPGVYGHSRKSSGPGRRSSKTKSGVFSPDPSLAPRTAKPEPKESQGSCGHSRLPGSSKDENSKRSFACPFYRKNPRKYQNCASFDLVRIKDVKQHLDRKHKLPAVFCPRCHEAFETNDVRDAHAQKASCDILPEYDGITEDHMWEFKTKKYSSRGKSFEEQWFDIWDIVFPYLKSHRPRSVYVGDAVEESKPLWRSFWNDMRVQILAELKAVRKEGLSKELSDSIDNAMTTTFDLIEDTSMTAPRTGGAQGHQATPVEDTRQRVLCEGPPTFVPGLDGAETTALNMESPNLDGWANGNELSQPSGPSSIAPMTTGSYTQITEPSLTWNEQGYEDMPSFWPAQIEATELYGVMSGDCWTFDYPTYLEDLTSEPLTVAPFESLVDDSIYSLPKVHLN